MKPYQNFFLLFIWLILGACSSGNELFVTQDVELNDEKGCEWSASDGFLYLIEQENFEGAFRLAASEQERKMVRAANAVLRGEVADFEFEKGDFEAFGRLFEQAGAWDRSDWKYLDSISAIPGREWVDSGGVKMGKAFYALRGSPEIRFPADSLVLPMRMTGSGNPMVQVHLGDRDYWFWLDTGAGTNVLREKVARASGVNFQTDLAAEVGSSTEKTIETWPALVDSLWVGEMLCLDQPVAVLPDRALSFRVAGIPLFKVDGIIGWPLLKQWDVTFDFPGERLVIRKPMDLLGEEDWEWGYALEWFWQPRVRLKGNEGCPLFLEMDTGSGSTFFYPSAKDKLGGRFSGMEKQLMGGAGGNQLREVERWEDVRFRICGESLGLSEVQVHPDRVTDDNPFAVDGVLGQDVLRRGVLRLDWVNGRWGWWM